LPKLPLISGRKAVKALSRFGWREVMRRGSHNVLCKEGTNVTISVPDHKELGRGTLRKVIRHAGLEVAELIREL